MGMVEAMVDAMEEEKATDAVAEIAAGISVIPDRGYRQWRQHPRQRSPARFQRPCSTAFPPQAPRHRQKLFEMAGRHGRCAGLFMRSFSASVR